MMLHRRLLKPPARAGIALRIEWLHVEPLVWRRALVPNSWTLLTVYRYLQWVMGWQDSHAHEFRLADRIAAPLWWIEEVGIDSLTHEYIAARLSSIS